MKAIDLELTDLLSTLEALETSWSGLQDQWVGRHVILTHPIASLPAPRGGTVHVGQGAIGEIVQVTHSKDAPFVLRFPGFPYRIAPQISHLVIVQEQSPEPF